MKIQVSKRIQKVPPYIFSEINRWKKEAKEKGKSLLSLAIGDPDLPTPLEIIQKIEEAARKPENHGYSAYEGSALFRKAVATRMQNRFGVKVDENKEVLALIGSKEGIAHFPYAFCNPGDVALFPDPGYPVFKNAILAAGGEAVPIPLRAESGFLPKREELEKLFVQYQPKFAILNFPSNPTGVTCPFFLLEEIVQLALRHSVILVMDNAYSEIYFDEKEKPVSILEIPRAKEIAIEFHSLSKSFNMTGWRIGAAVGNSSLIAGLLQAKTIIDSGPLLAVQEAASFALQNSERFIAPLREIYQKRKAIVTAGLKKLNLEFFETKASFFIWVKVPGTTSSLDFAKQLIEEQGLIVVPGIGFGEYGEGFFRLSLTAPEETLEEGMERLAKYTRISICQF